MRQRVELTRKDVKEITELADTLLRPNLPIKLHKKFAYALAFNRRVMSAEYEGFKVEDSYNEDFIKYISKCDDAKKEASEKDDNDKPIIVNNDYLYNNNSRIILNKKLTELSELYKDVIEARDKWLYEKIEEELTLHMLNLNYVSIKPLDNKNNKNQFEEDHIDGTLITICFPFIFEEDKNQE